MVEVIEFPAKAARDWRAVEMSIRKILSGHGADDAAIAAITGRMSAFFELCNRKFRHSVAYKSSRPRRRRSSGHQSMRHCTGWPHRSQSGYSSSR